MTTSPTATAFALAESVKVVPGAGAGAGQKAVSRAGATEIVPAAETADQVVDPSDWWRRICWVTPQLALSGDLGDDLTSMRANLASWADAGITHIVDVRMECDDRQFVAQRAPHISYRWLGVDDDGGRRTADWFDFGAAVVADALTDPSAKVLVHCHMGVNRGPSLLFAAMLELGHDPVWAIEAIRTARPIAAVLYADDAIAWWVRRGGGRPSRRLAVCHWMRAHPVDTKWIVSRLWASAQAPTPVPS